MMKSHYRGWLCLVAVPKAIVLGTEFKGSVCKLNRKKKNRTFKSRFTSSQFYF